MTQISSWAARQRRHRFFIISATALFLLALVYLSCFVGVAEISLPKAIRYIAGQRGEGSLTRMQWVSWTGIRLLRIALGLTAGYLLAMAGSLMQCITGNAMASPFTTGVSSAAAFGAGLAILLSLRIFGSLNLGMIVLAFVMAAGCSVLVFGIASLKALGRNAIILTGIALSYLFSALQSLLQFVASDQNLSSIVSWTFGSLTRGTWSHVMLLGLAVVVVTVVALVYGHSYTLLELGDETATAMGVPVQVLRLGTGLLVTLTAALVVSFTGIIGFVGLVGPHIAHFLIGSERRVQLPLSGLIGAALVVAADLIGRTVMSPVEIPVGIIVSLIGVPLFVWLILRSRQEG
ncbi:MAG: FecCD family ABC transporter permease [Propionibacteriaceae bacterium]